MRFATCVLIPLLLLGACGRHDDADEPAAADDTAIPAPVISTAPNDTANAVRPPTTAEVEAADREYERDLARRMATRETYSSCMAKLRGVDAEARAPVEAACRRLPGAPH